MTCAFFFDNIHLNEVLGFEVALMEIWWLLLFRMAFQNS